MVKIKKNKTNKTHLFLYIFGGALAILYLSIFFMKDIKNSLYFSKKGRINIVIYDKDIRFYSFGREDNIDYLIPLYADLKTKVPGGYGMYRIGALGKLAQLEKKEDIFKKTFSSLTSTFVDFYFYKDINKINYGDKIDLNQNLPSLSTFLYFKSNANFFDRLYLFSLLSKKRPQYFKLIDDLSAAGSLRDNILPNDYFLKHYAGYFYDKTYRSDKKNVQIKYTNSYDSAANIGNILEGNGIRNGDISADDTSSNKCLVKEDTAKFSLTAQAIATFFKCSLVKDRTDIYDIILELGDREKDWE